MLQEAKDAFTRLYVRVRHGQSGATAVEYGLMVALIAAVIILAVVFLGQETSETFSCTGTSISTKGKTNC